MNQTFPHKTNAPQKGGTLLDQAGFHLVYLLFYFTPWMFQRPAGVDMFAAAIAICVFLPIYFQAFAKSGLKYILLAIGVELIAFAVGPFNGMQGTFHIYAASMAGFQENWRRAVITITLLGLAYIAFATLVLNAHPIETGMVILMSAIIGATCIASTQSISISKARERSLMLDRQLAAVEERERIARDLHDILGHTLTMVAVKADLAGKLLDGDPDKARAEISDIHKAARGALRDVRDTVSGMTITTVETEIARAQETFAAADIRFDVSGEVPDLAPSADKAIGLAIREAATNIIRHSGASSATLTLAMEGTDFVFSMSDNGGGSDRAIVPGAGLQGLKRRITALGGDAVIDVGNGYGARLDITLPLPEGGSA